MAKFPAMLLSPSLFRKLAADYRRRWNIALAAANLQGRIVLGERGEKADNQPALCRLRALAITEALRWGEPTAQMGLGHTLCWAVPVMVNAQVTGGLIATLAERRLFARRGDRPTFDTHAACTHLRRLAEEANLTNGAFLQARRRDYRLEQMRAEGIASYKLMPRGGIRAMYLLDEPALLAAIRQNDRAQARAILNHLLATLHHHAGDRLDVIKSFFMELVVTMTRMAVEAGGAPQELLGHNYTHISQLASITSEETLAPWLHQMLERLMDALEVHRDDPRLGSVAAAVAYMHQHCAHDLSRDDVAAAVHLSPAHFSRLFKRQTGQTFGDALNQMRIQRATELLSRSPLTLKEIALESGFKEQSYFTKIFRKTIGATPRQYRQNQALPPSDTGMD